MDLKIDTDKPVPTITLPSSLEIADVAEAKQALQQIVDLAKAIAPDAELDDGLFDIVILRAASKFGLILDLRLLYGGRHRGHKAITILRGRKVVVEPLGDLAVNRALVDIDGESPGCIPATFEILPQALTLRC